MWHLTLPVITLTLAYLADYSLVMRSSLLDELGEDYLSTARAKGLRDIAVRRQHAARNALLPTVTLSAINIGFVVSGAITIETVFSIPGLGLLSYEAISIPDFWVLQGTFLIASAARDHGEPRGQPGLRTARPAGADMSDTTERLTPRQVRRRRRSASLRRTWRLFRANRAGMLGLVLLTFFVAGRRAGPGARRPRRPRGDQGHRRRARAAVRGVPAGHRRQRPLGADAADLGRRASRSWSGCWRR